MGEAVGAQSQLCSRAASASAPWGSLRVSRPAWRFSLSRRGPILPKRAKVSVGLLRRTMARLGR
jgi:hypothetical protein